MKEFGRELARFERRGFQLVVYETIARAPGQGRADAQLIQDILAGRVQYVFTKDVARLTHSQNGLGDLWADFIREQKVQVFVCRPSSARTALTVAEFRQLVSLHERSYFAKVSRRRQTGFKRSKRRLPAAMARIRDSFVVIAGVFHVIYKPVFDAEVVIMRTPGMTRKRCYAIIARRFAGSQHHNSFNGSPWTARNIRRVLNDPVLRKHYDAYCRKTGKRLRLKRPVSIVSTYLGVTCQFSPKTQKPDNDVDTS